MRRRSFIAQSAACLAVGCRTGSAGGAALVWGVPGASGGGAFRQPRAIGVYGGEVYVIDTTGRVQVFDLGGTHLRGWSTPSPEKGTPTAVGFGAEGAVVVPDTHYSRILEYDRQGNLARQWGNYGTSRDQFVYPTGIAWDSKGNQYVSEYGMGAERVHVFDAQRRFLREWGAHGEAPGQFNRAMAIDIASDDTVYVADTGNHRVQRFDTQGKLLGVIGGAGTAKGMTSYPYDVAVGPDDSVYVSEFGNHRVSRFDGEGKFIEAFGKPGRAPGQFNGPRGVAVSDDGRIFVTDTDNHRIQRLGVVRGS